MKAAWDWDMPRGSEEDERRLVEFAADLGFDTVIVDDPTPALIDRGHELGCSIVDIVRPRPTDGFRADHADCLQSIHPVEEAIVEALEDAPDDYHRTAHRRFHPVHGGDWLCFEREESLSFLEDRVSDALAVADGVAFDGFGFRNRYACYCDACEERRERMNRRTDDHEYDVLARVSEDQLIVASERLYDHAKDERADALITNHVWPPFDPNPAYGHRLRLDVCTQTIAWFHPPHWNLERVEFEASEHRRLEGEANRFVPFVGLYAEDHRRRPPARVKRELEIASEYGRGDLVLCTLGAPYEHPEYAAVVKDVVA